MFGGNYETAYICIVFSCRDDNAYSLVKSSLVFVLVLVLRCEHQNFFMHTESILFVQYCHITSTIRFSNRNRCLHPSTYDTDSRKGRYS